MPIVYLRHSATTPLDPRVAALISVLLAEDPRTEGGLLADGRRIAGILADSRAAVARFAHVAPDEIVFTSSGTEACNLALKGIAMARWRDHGPTGRILVASTEHTAVLYPARTLGKLGFEIAEIPVDPDGLVEPGVVADMMGTETFLVCVAGVTSETGTVQPLREIARVAHDRGALLHADLCLAAAGIDLDLRALGADLASFSAHKLGGPRGTGALYARQGVRLAPQIEGGLGESGRRGGAENVAGIAGFAAAAGYRREAIVSCGPALSAMTSRLEDALLSVEGVTLNGPGRSRTATLSVEGVTLNGPGRNRTATPSVEGATLNGPARARMAGIINVSVAGLDGEALLLKLASSGIAASSGSSCLTEIGKPSHVLTAMGVAPELARGSLLFSLGPDTTMDEIDHVIAVFPRVVAALRGISIRRGA